MTDPTLAERLARCVRKLEWTALSIDRGDGHSEPSGDYEAECFFDTYQIQAPDSRDCYTLSADHFSHPHKTLEAAKAAAQADYTARSLAIWDMDALAREVDRAQKMHRRAQNAEAAMGAVAHWLRALVIEYPGRPTTISDARGYAAKAMEAMDYDRYAAGDLLTRAEVEAMVGAETERCERIVSAARTGAIDTDFRTLLHFMGSKEQMLYDEKRHEYVPDHVRQDRDLQAAIRAREGGKP
jgi:hypothetical protein